MTHNHVFFLVFLNQKQIILHIVFWDLSLRDNPVSLVSCNPAKLQETFMLNYKQNYSLPLNTI